MNLGSFDYNSHDMLNKLDKFSRNKPRWKLISTRVSMHIYFFSPK